jgi:hypothetical protein
MLSEIYYLIRSRQDGSYLVARPQGAAQVDQPAPGFILIFSDHADALSYLNTHAAELAHQFAVESLLPTQLNGLLKRWGFRGIGLVEDPLLPRVSFHSR